MAAINETTSNSIKVISLHRLDFGSYLSSYLFISFYSKLGKLLITDLKFTQSYMADQTDQDVNVRKEKTAKVDTKEVLRRPLNSYTCYFIEQCELMKKNRTVARAQLMEGAGNPTTDANVVSNPTTDANIASSIGCDVVAPLNRDMIISNYHSLPKEMKTKYADRAKNSSESYEKQKTELNMKPKKKPVLS